LAQKAFVSGDFQKARDLYEIAYQDNPTHGYLKNMIDHLDYIDTKNAEMLLEQYRRHSGNYGPRKFYVDKGRFYYKRKNEELSLPRLEMLALNDSQYIDVSRPGTIMSFETGTSGKPISKSYSFTMYDDGNYRWDHRKTENVQNYFEKDD
jgi:hypothetical protein